MDYNDEEPQKGVFPLWSGEDQYHKMVEEVEDYAILMFDSRGIIRNWNKGAERIKGYTEEEIVGHHFRIFYTKEDREAGLPEKLVNEAVTNGKAVHEGWRVRKDGTTFWGSIVITALHNEDGRVIGFSKVTRDLTERKMTEAFVRARTTYFHQVGYYTLGVRESREQRLMLLPLYIGILTGRE